MAKRRVNKPLVAFLTIAGVMLAVMVVAVGTLNAAGRDPVQIAETAQQREEAGNYREASRLYRKAFARSKDPQYLVDAARVAFKRGDPGETLQLLRLAYAEQPSNPEVLKPLLETHWEIRRFIGLPEGLVGEVADALLEIEEDNLTALAMKAAILYGQAAAQPEKADEADALLARAMEIDATDPKVALVRAERRLQQVGAAAQRSGGGREQIDPVADEVAADLTQALEAHPDDAQLRLRLAGLYRLQEDWAQAEEVLRAGLGKGTLDSELRMELGALVRQRLLAEFDELSEERVVELVREGTEAIDAALEEEPAFYQGYTLRATLQRLKHLKTGAWEERPLELQQELLSGLEEALQDTVGLQSVRARLGANARLQMITEAFDLALNFHRRAEAPAVREQALTFMRRFVQEADSQFPDEPRVALFEGYLAEVEGDVARALQSFERAARTSDNLAVQTSAREELAKLHRGRQQPGVALQVLDEAIAGYTSLGRAVPPQLLLMRVDLLVSNERAEEAMALLERIEPTLPESAQLAPLRARVLSALGLEREARAALAEGGTTDSPAVLLVRARVAASAGDLETAIENARRAVELEPNNLEAWTVALQLYREAERIEAGEALLESQGPRVTDAGVRRQLEFSEIMFTEPDEAARDARILALMEENPDPQRRASELFTFYWQRQRYEEARPYLDELEERDPNNESTLRQQLQLALQLDECERARSYASRLAALNADRANGATFRAMVATECGTRAEALREYRAAERAFPTDSGIKIRIAQMLMTMEPPRFGEAVDVLQQAVDYAPQNALARRLLYICYENLGRRAEGVPHLEVAARQDPSDPFVQERMQFLEEERDPQAGIAQRERQREENPDDVANLVRLAELYQKVGNMQLAQERLVAAAELAPDNLQLAGMAGSVFAQSERPEVGERIIREHLATQAEMGRLRAELMLARYLEMTGAAEAAEARLNESMAWVRESPPTDEGGENAAAIMVGRELAEFYSRQRDHAKTAAAYRTLATLAPEGDVETRKVSRLGAIAALMNQKEMDAAKAEIAAFRRDYPEDVRGVRLAAEAAIQADDKQAARTLLDEALRAAPNDLWSLWMRGRLSIAERKFAAAREDLAEAKSVSPTAFNMGPRNDLVRALVLAGEYRLAEAELREILTHERETRDAEVRLISLLRRNERLAEAQQFVNELIAQEPDEPFWRIQLAELMEARRQYSAAADALRQAIDRMEQPDPGLVSSWMMLLNSANRGREIVQLYERYRPEQRTPRIKAAVASALMGLDRRDEALALAKEAAQDAFGTGNFGIANTTLRFLSEGLGRDAMIAQVRSAVESLRPEAPVTPLARLLFASQLVGEEDAARLEEGVQVASAVLAELPADSNLRTFAMSIRATGLGELGRTEEAVQAYEAVLERSPDNVQVLNNLAYLLADELDKPAQAVPYAERARDLDSDNPMVLDTLGWTYFRNNQLQQAEAVLLDASRIAPNNRAVRYHLGRVYAATNRLAEARGAFRQVVESGREAPEDDYVRRAQEALQNLQ